MLVDILGYTPNMPTKIGTLSLDIVRNIEYQYDQEVSSHPVETGFEIQDNAVNHPLKITMRAGVSSHPVTWFYVNGIGKSKFNDAIAALEAIRDAKMPVTILRPDRILNDMYLTSCRPVKDSDSKSVRWIDLTFLHIQKVTVQTTEVPENIVDASVKESAGETAADGGAATQTDVGSLSTASTSAGATDAAESAADAAEAADNRTWWAQASDYASESELGQKVGAAWKSIMGGD